MFTHDEDLADQISRRLGQDCQVDTTDRPALYCFFAVPELRLSRAKLDIYSNQELIEIRDPDRNGEVVWPNPRGFRIQEVLDLV